MVSYIYEDKEKAMTRSGKSVSLQRVAGWCEVTAEILSKSPSSFSPKGFVSIVYCLLSIVQARRVERVLTLQGSVLMDTHEGAVP